MDKWWAYNDPMWTDMTPYGNRISIMNEHDIWQAMIRMHPDRGYQLDAPRSVQEWAVVNWAWRVAGPPQTAAGDPSTGQERASYDHRTDLDRALEAKGWDPGRYR